MKVVLTFASFSLALAGLATAAELPPGYDALLVRARQGDFAPALAALRSSPPQGRLLNDYLAVAGWAGLGEEVLQVYERHGKVVALADYALLQVARAYRDARRWDQALAAYGEGSRRFPEQDGFTLGTVMTLADAGRLDEARAQGERLVQQRPVDPDRRLALAYVYGRRQQPFDVLLHSDQAYALAPARADVQLAYVQALQQARLPVPALRVLAEHPGLGDAALRRSLQGDAAAELTRLAATPSRSEAERFVLADQALARYEQLLAEWGAQQPQPQADLLRLRIDQLAALHARVRMQELVERYEALRAEGVVLPNYILSNVASAYLYLRQPEQARALYAQSLKIHSEAGNNAAWHQDELGLYYSLLEAEDWDGARAVALAAQARQPIWRWESDSPERKPNAMRLSTDSLVAQHAAFANDTPEAQQLFDAMVSAAPHNTELRTSRAGVLAVRSLPRAAEQELKLAETLAPRARSVELGQGSTALALQEWRQAELLSQDLLARYPEHRGVQRLGREWQVHNMAELKVDGYRGLRAGSVVSGESERGLDAVLYSPPLAYDWRIFGGAGQASTRFDEGQARYRWQRAGAQWRVRDLQLEGELSSNRYGLGARTGASLTLAYDIDDHWQVGAGLASHSRAAPLRALLHGIHVNRADLSLRWRADERREWSLGLSPSRFSDGNQRTEAVLQGSERLYAAPRWWLDGLLELAASRNSQEGGPYFNPGSDASALASLRATHILYRHYQTVWQQQLTLGLGSYQQQGFGSGAITAWSYGQRLRHNDVLELGASLAALSRPYDGRREKTLRLSVDLTYRF